MNKTGQTRILTINAGSSSLKFAVFDDRPEAVLSGSISSIGGDGVFEIAGNKQPVKMKDHAQALAMVAEWIGNNLCPIADFAGIGHRIVHGGSQFTGPVVLDKKAMQKLESLARLAPLHMPFALRAIAALEKLAPEVKQIGCFDTAFHTTRPVTETRIAIPEKWDAAGYSNYGFHGLSYEHIAYSLPKNPGSRVLAAHLGQGSSMCAMVDGKSVATSMGFSTLNGLIMGTRCGSIDPGVILALIQQEGLSTQTVSDMLYHQSGLYGLSGGLSGDMQTLLASHELKAKHAVEQFCHHAVRHAASLIAAMGGIDRLVFTGGIGQNSEEIRQRITSGLEWIGEFEVMVFAADEELTIARHVIEFL